MQNFNAEFKYEKSAAHNFSQKKLQAKEGAEIKLFMLLLIQGYFLWFLTFFGGLFLQFFEEFCTHYKILRV